MNNPEQDNEDDNWMPIADIMAGLFVVFLFIAIVSIHYISEIESALIETENALQTEIIENDIPTLDEKQRTIIDDYRLTKKEIYAALKNEFRFDLYFWQAEIDPNTLIFRFTAPEILFQKSSAEVSPRFKTIISNFFPRYLRTLEQFFPKISEIRVEGHTSSEWENAENEKEAFLENMKLSQDRTQSVLAYCLGLPIDSEQRASWVRQHITANGFSSTRLIKTKEGEENKESSRRVEFKIYLDVDKILNKIEKSLDDNI